MGEGNGFCDLFLVCVAVGELGRQEGVGGLALGGEGNGFDDLFPVCDGRRRSRGCITKAVTMFQILVLNNLTY